MIIRAYLSGIVPPLCITREVSCHCSGSSYDIGSFAARYVRDLFGNVDVFADGLNQKYYFVATPAKRAGASAVQIAGDPFVGGWDVYCLRASGSDDKGVKIPQLLARLRSEFQLTQLTEEVIVASCCPPQQSEISDCERTFDDCTTMSGDCMCQLALCTCIYKHCCCTCTCTCVHNIISVTLYFVAVAR